MQEPAQRKFVPTTVLDAPDSLALMREEIFGPVLPVVTYRQLDEAVDYINALARRLSLYVFDDDQARVARVLEACTAGRVAINDCVFQFAQSRLPFGGIGPSGMGAYHRHAGFLAFSKQMPVFRQARWSATTCFDHPTARARSGC